MLVVFYWECGCFALQTERLKRSHVLVEEVFEFFLGKESLNHLENNALLLLVKFLYEPDLLNGAFVPHRDFLRDIIAQVHQLVNRNIEELGNFVNGGNGDFPLPILYFAVIRAVHPDQISNFMLLYSSLLP